LKPWEFKKIEAKGDRKINVDNSTSLWYNKCEAGLIIPKKHKMYTQLKARMQANAKYPLRANTVLGGKLGYKKAHKYPLRTNTVLGVKLGYKKAHKYPLRTNTVLGVKLGYKKAHKYPLRAVYSKTDETKRKRA
jgi:hypothetical protein